MKNRKNDFSHFNYMHSLEDIPLLFGCIDDENTMLSPILINFKLFEERKF